MGHQRLGRLPLRRTWKDVVESLALPSGSPALVATSTAKAAENALQRAADSPYVWYPFWIITQLTATARDPEAFRTFLSTLNEAAEQADSALDLVVGLSQHVSERQFEGASRDAFAELAADAFQVALSGMIAEHTASLFGPSAENAREAFSKRATAAGFAELAREYLGAFFGKALAYFLSYDLSNHIGPENRFSSVKEAENFNQALYGYAKDVSFLVQDFGKGWYSKSLWQKGDISPETARAFLYVAFRKFRQQLEREVE